jgi:hypothetical protein
MGERVGTETFLESNSVLNNAYGIRSFDSLVEPPYVTLVCASELLTGRPEV